MSDGRATRNRPPPRSPDPDIVLVSERTLGRPPLNGSQPKRRDFGQARRTFSPDSGIEWSPGDHANAQSVTILREWARSEIELELEELKTIASMQPDSLDHQVALKKQWVKSSLRGKYRLYVQKHFSAAVPGLRQRLVAGSLASHRSGSMCEHPACKKTFLNGEFRISFEPNEWSEDGDEGGETELEQVETNSQMLGVGNDEGIGYMHCLHLAGGGGSAKTPRFPDYAELMTDSNIELYGGGEFYCLTCFELLLEPIQKNGGPPPPVNNHAKTTPNSRKRGNPAEAFTRPSAICRIYDRVFAETRVHPEGRFALDDESCEIIRQWKDAQYRAGIKKMKSSHGSLFKHGTGAGTNGNFIEFEDGMGVAECLALEAAKRRKR